MNRQEFVEALKSGASINIELEDGLTFDEFHTKLNAVQDEFSIKIERTQMFGGGVNNPWMCVWIEGIAPDPIDQMFMREKSA